MGLGVSIFLIAVGAILTFAVNVTTSGLDLSAVGVILMLVGGVGIFADLVLFGDRGPFGRQRTTIVDSGPDVVVDRAVVDRGPVLNRGTTVVEESYVDDVGRVADPLVVPGSRRRVVRRREVL
ncbi:MAG: DUF6458 family protein [Acidimicrobiales bacterium]